MSFTRHAGITHEGGRWTAQAQNRGSPDMMLKNKVAVVYEAGGGIGGAVARAFASPGLPHASMVVEACLRVLEDPRAIGGAYAPAELFGFWCFSGRTVISRGFRLEPTVTQPIERDAIYRRRRFAGDVIET